jgi:adenine-specific DNA-methyltransferase
VGDTSAKKPAPQDAEAPEAGRVEATNSGRLELTWSNKDRALLSHEDGSYEWVQKTDHRVAEVRLLQEAGEVGQVRAAEDRVKDNLLIRGDALNALTALTRSPEFAEEYAGKIKLAYLDPPFNTGQAFEHYDDGLEHSVWLTMMRDRLMQIKELLAPDGSVWVHLDDAEMAYCRTLMDEIFGRANFKATVVWQRTTSARNDASGFSTDQDYVLIFGNQDFVPNGMPRSEASEKAYKNPDSDERGEWREGDYKTGRGYSYAIRHPKTGAGVFPPPGSKWRYPESTHELHKEQDLLWWGKTKNYRFPKVKRFRSAVGDTVVPQTLWLADEVDTTRRAKTQIKKLFPNQTPFETPKPELLMERIIRIASNAGDIVLDCFAGSGTTAAVAHKMGRRWITVEREVSTVDNFTAPRLEKLIAGQDPGGVTELLDWKGGGGFRVLNVAPSIFTEDSGIVVLAEGITNGALAEAVAAQLGFAYQADPPFCGRQGRLRLAVVDGHADEATISLLVNALKEDEKLSLAATSLDPGASSLLAKLRRGSQARVVPQDILLSYRTPSAWRVSVAREEPDD